MKTRWFNYRPLCLILLFLLLGSVFAFYVKSHLVVSIVVALIFLALIVFVAITRKKIAYLLVPIISFGLGLGVFDLAVSNFDKLNENPTLIQARVYSLDRANDNYLKLRTDSVYFDGKSVSSNLEIYLYDKKDLYKNIEVGSVIRFLPTNIRKVDLLSSDIPNSNYYANNIKFVVTAYMENLTYITTDKSFAEQIKQKIKQNLNKGLSNENTAIAYSALFGDKELLSESYYSAYKLSGVAHLLAVSGLHVGIIVAILGLLLKLLHVKKWGKVAIMAVFLLAYAYVCNFSVSVVRASIMSLFILMAPLLYREYDTLSALSCAGILLFFINPLTAFDVGFLLSFSCVLGITMFASALSAALQKAKLPKWLADSLALSASTVISLVFVMAYFFKTLNIIAILANIVIIPIFTLVFAVVFVFAILSLILPFATYALVVVNPIFNFINLIASVFSGLPFANLGTIDIGFLAIFIYFVILFLMSGLTVTRKRTKMLTILPIVAFLLIYML